MLNDKNHILDGLSSTPCPATPVLHNCKVLMILNTTITIILILIINIILIVIIIILNIIVIIIFLWQAKLCNVLVGKVWEQGAPTAMRKTPEDNG